MASRALIIMSIFSLLAAGCGKAAGDGDGSEIGQCSPATPCADGKTCIDSQCINEAAECSDADGDGFGDMCLKGPDCDDNNARAGGDEICDGADNDCDGNVDENVKSACGSCDMSCALAIEIDSETDDGHAFDLEDQGVDHDGVGLDENGALVLDSTKIGADFIWVANTGEGSVSRFNTTTYEEEGRYISGPDGGNNDPSRTSVNRVGDVYVGNRRRATVSRISILGDRCPDTNKDGAITTSHGNERLAYGSDDCVLWNTDLSDVMPDIRAVAAQDIVGLDGEITEYVWLGANGSNTAVKLDGRTGEILLIINNTPTRHYGFALDGHGNLYSANQGRIGRIDTTQCISPETCVQEAECKDNREGNPACTMESIKTPHNVYGITVDFKQRVWVGGQGVGRFDPAAAEGARWAQANSSFIHGIAADANGFVWGASGKTGITQVNAETLEVSLFPGTEDVKNKGIAVDSDGKIWSITSINHAVVVTPGAGMSTGSAEKNVAPSIGAAYTYSDMTGLQARLSTNAGGHYRHIAEGCDSGDTAWGELQYDAVMPKGTSILFRAKTAATREELDDAEWVVLGNAPDDEGPFSIGDAFAAAGAQPGQFIMVELALKTAITTSTSTVVTPKVYSFSAQYSCEGPVLQ